MAKLDKQFASIPRPTTDPLALLKALEAVIANVEVLTGQRGKGIKGVADQLTDLRSQAEGREARFTDYIEVSTANGEALAQRTTTLEAEMDDVTAEVTRIDKAYVAGDEALAQSIETVETQYNDISAQGQVRLVSRAGPAGYSAEYAWTLTAGAAYTGMSFLAKQNPDGSTSSEVVLTAEAFKLMDPTLGPVPVFAYANQFYTFNVPVRFTDDVFIDGTLRGKKLENNGVTRIWFDRKNDADRAQASVQVRSGSAIKLEAFARGDPAQPFLFTTVHYLTIFRFTGNDTLNPVQIDRIPLQSFFAGNSDNRATYFTQTSLLTFDAPAEGNYTYVAITSSGIPGVNLSVTEFYK